MRHLTLPRHAHLHTWKQTHGVDVRHVAVSGVGSLTALTNWSLCSHRHTTPRSTHTGLFGLHCLTYQLTVYTSQLWWTDCILYQSGAGFKLKRIVIGVLHLKIRSKINQNSLKIRQLQAYRKHIWPVRVQKTAPREEIDCSSVLKLVWLWQRAVRPCSACWAH